MEITKLGQNVDTDRQAYEILKKNIINYYELTDFTLSDDELKTTLETYLLSYYEMFAGYMDKVILRKYYQLFLANISPKIISFTQSLTETDGLQPQLYFREEKQKISKENMNAINQAFATFLCEPKNDEIHIPLSIDEKMSNELYGLLFRPDIFEQRFLGDPHYASIHLERKWIYEPQYWQGIIQEREIRVAQIEHYLKDTLANSEADQDIEEFALCANFYHQFVTKYNYYSALEQYQALRQNKTI